MQGVQSAFAACKVSNTSSFAPQSLRSAQRRGKGPVGSLSELVSDLSFSVCDLSFLVRDLSFLVCDISFLVLGLSVLVCDLYQKSAAAGNKQSISLPVGVPPAGIRFCKNKRAASI